MSAMVKQVAKRGRRHADIGKIDIRQIRGNDGSADAQPPLCFCRAPPAETIRDRDADERMGDVIQLTIGDEN